MADTKYPNTTRLAGSSLAARKARDKARKAKAAAKARAEEFGSDMSPTMTAYEKSKARAVAAKRSASIKAGDGNPDPKKLANPKTKPKTEGDSRYRPGKGGVGDARYRPGKGSVTAAAGLKLTKKPNNTSNASTSTTKKPVSMPKSRPKRTTSTASKKTPTSSYDEVKPQKKTAKKPTKTRTPTTKSRDKDGLGRQSNKVVPKGAVLFNGSINKKTHKLRNINGKTYKVKK